MGEVVNPPCRQGKTSVVDRPGAPRQFRRMDFNLTEDQRAIQDMARDFAAAELAPHSAKWDEEKIFPVEALRAAAALGLAGIYIREDVGGSGLGRAEAQIVF